MTYELQEKTVLVTGANRGIGFAFVEELLARGVKHIYATTRQLANGQALQALSPRVTVVELDIDNSASILALVEKIPVLDVLINNAGIANGSSFGGEDAVAIASIEMQTNYFGPLQLTNKLLPRLRASSAAAILNVSSIAGISNFPALAPYSASKAALHSLTQGLRAELQAEHIFVQGIYPGPVDTRMTANFEMSKAHPQQVVSNILDALAAGEEDVFPDDFSTAMNALFQQAPKSLEKQFASTLG